LLLWYVMVVQKDRIFMPGDAVFVLAGTALPAYDGGKQHGDMGVGAGA